MLRDIIAGGSIGRDIPAFFSMYTEIIVCILTATLIFLLAAIFKRKYVEEEETVGKINNVLDALGIGVFSAAGTAAYLELGPLVALIMGMLSSIGGSLTRDVIIGDVPQVLRKRIYALATLAGSAAYYVTAKFIIPGTPYCDVVSTVVCVVLIFSIRMMATVFKWNMPKAIDFAKIKAESEQEEAEKIHSEIK